MGGVAVAGAHAYTAFMTLLLLSWALVTPGWAGPAGGAGLRGGPPLTERAPGPFVVPTLPGEGDRRGSADGGVWIVEDRTASQVLSWEPPMGTLERTAAHERALVGRAAVRADAQPPPPGALTRRDVAGVPAVAFEVRVERTAFVGTAWDCPSVRVVLVTFGRRLAAVRRLHQRSLAHARCEAPGMLVRAPGASGPPGVGGSGAGSS